jgi:hypothetical protein
MTLTYDLIKHPYQIDNIEEFERTASAFKDSVASAYNNSFGSEQ